MKHRFSIRLSSHTIHSHLHHFFFQFCPLKFSHPLLFNLCLIFINLWFIFINLSMVIVVFAIVLLSHCELSWVLLSPYVFFFSLCIEPIRIDNLYGLYRLPIIQIVNPYSFICFNYFINNYVNTFIYLKINV